LTGGSGASSTTTNYSGGGGGGGYYGGGGGGANNYIGAPGGGGSSYHHPDLVSEAQTVRLQERGGSVPNNGDPGYNGNAGKPSGSITDVSAPDGQLVMKLQE
jgi:hypothetical protein